MSRGTAYIIQTSKLIAPFNDPVTDVLVNQRPLGERQTEALSELGFTVRRVAEMGEIPEEDYPCLALTDPLYFSAAPRRNFRRAAEGAAGSAQCAVPKETAFSRIF